MSWQPLDVLHGIVAEHFYENYTHRVAKKQSNTRLCLCGLRVYVTLLPGEEEKAMWASFEKKHGSKLYQSVLYLA